MSIGAVSVCSWIDFSLHWYLEAEEEHRHHGRRKIEFVMLNVWRNEGWVDGTGDGGATRKS